MELFLFTLILLSLLQVAFSHSGRTDSKGEHWDRETER